MKCFGDSWPARALPSEKRVGGFCLAVLVSFPLLVAPPNSSRYFIMPSSSSAPRDLDMGDLFRQRREKANSRVNAAFDSRRGGQRSGGRAQQILAYPLEQGSIRNLKDNFGFIQCVERNEEIFFHYSEVIEGAAGLQVDQEVEFRFGADPRSGRLAAFQIKTLPPGTIEWETVEYDGVRQTGLIERKPRIRNQNGRNNGGGSDTTEGTIRLLKEKVTNGEEGKEETTVVTKDGPLVRFHPKDYNGGDATSGDVRRRNELGMGDLVECLVVKEKRSGQCYAREIVRLLTERERTRQEEEKKMMASARLEKGVVVALKDGFGFLRSSSRREEIFFHYDSIDMNEGDTPKDSDEEENFVLKEGQEMQFLVVDESAAKKAEEQPKSRTVQRRISARRVKIQPRGSVKFNEVIARGVTGVLVETPQCIDSSHALETHGKIILESPVEAKKFSMGESVEGIRKVTEVFLSPQDSPGGRFSFHNGSSVGLYVEPGDTLLFDLVIDYCDGACRAVPTSYLTPKDSEGEAKKDEDAQAVRLINLSLAGRAEGCVGAVKDTYGFIQYVERPVDVHFRMFQLLPDSLQSVLRLNMGIASQDENGKPLRLEVGANVQFDLSLRGTIGVAKPRGRRAMNERENLKAQRVLLLPPDSVQRFKRVATAVKGQVRKQELMQPFVGNVELDEPIQQMQPNLRHPFVWKMLSQMVEQGNKRPIMFHDTQSHCEEEVVRKLAASFDGNLQVTVEDRPPARLIKISSSDNEAEEVTTDEVTPTESAPVAEVTEKPKTEPKSGKLLKSVRFDKKSFSEQSLNDLPPGIDDIIKCDIVQCRRTGQSHVENIEIVERKQDEVESLGVTTTGIVKDIGFSALFGVVVVADESEYNNQTIYFRVPVVDGVATKCNTIKKGDNVKFDLGKESNGRVVALSLTKIAKGSVARSSGARSDCRGILLLQPAHTSLKNTPNRKGSSGLNGPPLNETNNRWGKVGKEDLTNGNDEPVSEMGCILVTEDPNELFVNERGAAPPKDSLRDKNFAKVTTDGKLILRFKTSAIAGNPYSHGGKEVPRRGDLVTFSRGTSGKGPIEIKTLQREAATPVRGKLVGTSFEGGKATFEAEAKAEKFSIDLQDIVTCDPMELKDNEKVEGLIHDGVVYGISRVSDLYLESKRGVGHKERPKLNLTVKKDRGGTIMAQSKQAKGPDGKGDGFTPGWTTRSSKYSSKPRIETDLSATASDYIPSS